MNSHFGRVNGWIILGHLIILVVGRVSGLPYQDPGEGGWVTTHKGGKSVPDHASISSPFLNLCGAVCLAFALFLKKAISKCVGILLRVPLFMYELHIWSLYFLILWCSGRVGAGKKIRKALTNNCPLFFFFFQFSCMQCSEQSQFVSLSLVFSKKWSPFFWEVSLSLPSYPCPFNI